MDIFEAIKTRRSVKHFDPHHRMSDGEIHRLLSLAVLSPTAFNIQNWRFVIVEDQDLRRRIRRVAWDQSQVTEASLLIVLCADLRSWERDPERYWRNAPQDVRDFVLPAIDQYYRGREQVQRDEAMRSCGIAVQTLMLAAKGMGYESCPMDGFDYGAVGKLINLPEDHVVALMAAIGKPVKGARLRGGQLPLDDVVIKDRFHPGGS